MEQFNDIISSKSYVLIAFYDSQNRECNMTRQMLSQLKSKWGDRLRIITIDINKNQSIATKYNIQIVPAFVLLKDKCEIWRHQGTVSLSYLNATISNYLQQPSGHKPKIIAQLNKKAVKIGLAILFIVICFFGYIFWQDYNAERLYREMKARERFAAQKREIIESIKKSNNKPQEVKKEQECCPICLGKGFVGCTACDYMGIHISSTGNVKTCSVCNGDPWKTCNTCDGTGRLNIQQNQNQYQYQNQISTPIPSSNGNTIQPIIIESKSSSSKDNRIPCSDCGSSGICKHCNGEGKQIKDVGMYIGETSYEVVDCPFCYSGKCSNCGGKGYY